MKWLFSLLLTATLLTCGCAAPSARQGGFASDNPATLLYAIQEAGQNKDASKIPNLVEALENDDPAVRMMAIVALERITGSRMNYNPYASHIDRAPAVGQWQQFVRQGSPAGDDAVNLSQEDVTDSLSGSQ